MNGIGGMPEGTEFQNAVTLPYVTASPGFTPGA